MDIFDSRYYRLNRIVLSLSGQWPYLDKKKRIIPVLVIGTNLTIAIIATISAYFTVELNMNSTIEILQTLVPCSVGVVNYCTHMFKSKKVKELLDRIKFDWSSLKSKEEFLILENFAGTARMYTLIFTWFFYFLCFGFVCFANLPIILDILIAKNTSRPRKLPLPGEYFVDQNKYFNFILFHMCAYVVTGLYSLSAGLVLFETFMQHLCGMFSIVGYHLGNLFEEGWKGNCTKETELKSKIAYIVCLHDRVLHFCFKLNHCYAFPYCLKLGLIIILLTVDIFQLFHAVLIVHDTAITGICALNIAGCFVGLFFICFASQQLLDHSLNVFYMTYVSHWYLLPVKIQKMLVLIMVRSIRPAGVEALRTITASLDLWAKTVESAVSYFMVLYSLQFS